MKTYPWAACGLLGMALLLAGCRVNVITKVEPSGAGTLTTEIGMTPEEVRQVRSFGSDPSESVCASLSMSQDGAVKVPPFEEELRGEETWCVSVRTFEDMDELERLYRDLENVRIRELVLREGLFVYDIEIDAQESDGAPTLVELTWALELPGRLGSHNADSVEGKRLVWKLEPGQVAQLQASSDLLAPNLPFGLDEIGTRLPVWIVAAALCLCCGGVLVLAVVGLVLMLRRKSRDAGSH